MRGRVSRRITATAVSAAIVFGVAGAAGTAMATEAPQKRPVAVPSDAPVPDLGPASGLLKPISSLAEVVGAVQALLDGVVKGLPAADITKLADAVKAAIAKVTSAAGPATSALPATPPAAPALPALPSLGLPLPVAKAAPGAPAADPVADALATVQKAVDKLVKDLAAANVAAVVADATEVVTALLKALLAAVLSALKLPALPSLPVSVPGLPVS
ncbi:hypothetical protein [Streptomyces crystallinus]|uniref:Secreted protein n=1 Tax=Streptomyces crystallinus TaxID=68191 RepID=A0ABP3RXS7_9ACTN